MSRTRPPSQGPKQDFVHPSVSPRGKVVRRYLPDSESRVAGRSATRQSDEEPCP